MFERDPTNRNLPSQVLSDQQQQLYEELQERDKLLAQMYFSAIWVLSDSENPESVPQSAYSMREMLSHLVDYKPLDVHSEVNGIQGLWDKAIKGPQLTCDLDWKGKISEPLSAFLKGMAGFFGSYKGRPTMTKAADQFLRKEQHSASYYPEYLHRKRRKRLLVAYSYFNGVLHHGKRVSRNEFEEELRSTETLLLGLFLPSLFLPKLTEDFDSLDALIREGEDDADN